MFKKATLFAALFGAMAMGGCGTGTDETSEIINNLVQAGYHAEDIDVFDGLVYVQKDAHVTLQASREMIQVRPGTTEEQYRTTNLVNAPLKICVVPTSKFVTYSQLNAGLDAAIAKYNAENLSITFVRGSASDCGATISAKTTQGVGGNSGFPSGGLPYGTINIGTGLQSYSVGVNTHVVTHEIGHTIGFRHSDYYNRTISCGSGGNEGTAGVGAILIPGTPSTAVVGGSIMNSCFRSTETGEFTSSDLTALNYLY